MIQDKKLKLEIKKFKRELEDLQDKLEEIEEKIFIAEENLEELVEKKLSMPIRVGGNVSACSPSNKCRNRASSGDNSLNQLCYCV